MTEQKEGRKCATDSCIGREQMGALLRTVEVNLLEGSEENDTVLGAWGPPREADMHRIFSEVRAGEGVKLFRGEGAPYRNPFRAGTALH